MSIWTCRAAPLVAALGLAACSETDFAALGMPGARFSRQAPEAVRVAGKSVVVVGPSGYCIDKSALRDTEQGAFVILGSCAAISRNASQPHPEYPGLLTVSVAGNQVPEEAAEQTMQGIASYLATDEGRTLLSRTGQPGSVEILETRQAGPALFVHARDNSVSSRAAIADDYWRGFMSLKGRITSVTVVSPRNAPLDRDTGLETLLALTSRLWQANGIRQSIQ